MGVGKTTLIQKAIEVLQSSGVPVDGFYTQEVRQEGKRIGFDVVTLSGAQGPLSRVGPLTSEDDDRRPATLHSALVRWCVGSLERSQPLPGKPECRVGQYVVDLASFEQLALPVLRNILDRMRALERCGDDSEQQTLRVQAQASPYLCQCSGELQGTCMYHPPHVFLQSGAVPSCGPKHRVCIIDEIGKMELFSQPFIQAVRQMLCTPGTIVVGTIPVPKGKPLALVEEIRKRRDVKVFSVTRENRNSLLPDIVAVVQSNRT
ncbi:Cancer-related nucleoside-triphosphatase homolog [Apodemus speciosus]|uniref:Cancer-related nucleoside-triphosphatase homolog n=1 Tax=Apodemus speciosus TaxID=105296 RepID=A0ABQ0F3M2_APOSI